VAERALQSRDGSAIQLSPRLFETLLCLIERAGRLVDKQLLMDTVWAGVVVEDNTLSRTVSALRRALGERGRESRFIATVSGVGYRFVHPVAVVGADPAATAKPDGETPSRNAAPARGAGASEAADKQAAPRGPAAGAQPSALGRTDAPGSVADAARAIAVLPFADLSPDHDQQYLADGIAAEVLNRLTQIADLRVIARTSSFLLRDKQDDPRSVGERLGAEHLLTGSVRKDGARLRINVALVRAASDRQLWSRQFDCELADVFAIQEEIARAVTRALGATLATDVRSFGRFSTSNLEAYDLFLRGIAAAHRGGAETFLEAITLMHGALELDPEFAPAWLGVAAASRALLVFLPERSDEFRATLAQAADKANELVPDSWAAHLARSTVYHVDYDWERMERSLARAAELVPTLPAELGFNYGTFRAQLGDTAQAISHLERVVRDDPLSLMASSVLQTVLLAGERYEESEAEYRRSLGLPGNREVAEHAALQRAWARGDDASAAFRRHIETQRRLDLLDDLYEIRDRPRAALSLLRRAADVAGLRDPTRQIMLAWWLAHYGDTDGALTCLERAYIEARYANVAFLWYPVLSEARRDRRFKEIVRGIGLVDYWRSRGDWGDHFRPLDGDDFESV
jgi:TolB-like protein/DNA-binding winged helix-turn-helix (wHTH) protein